jgi:hypothetical protein
MSYIYVEVEVITSAHVIIFSTITVRLSSSQLPKSFFEGTGFIHCCRVQE